MKKNILILVIGLSAGISTAQNKVSVNADLPRVQISRHIYGHFAEHLGRCIYDGLYIGDENTIIPNTNGVRNDVIAALKQLNIPNLRWPGGCFADTYHWEDAVGPKNERIPVENLTWGNVLEDNSFGTNEFLNMCELIGAEPYLAVNMNSGTGSRRMGSVRQSCQWNKLSDRQTGKKRSEQTLERKILGNRQ